MLDKLYQSSTILAPTPTPNQFILNQDTECTKTKQKLNTNMNALLLYILLRWTVLYSLRGREKKTQTNKEKNQTL